MLKSFVSVFAILFAAGATCVWAADDKAPAPPAEDSVAAGTLEVRANQAFAAGDWAKALPLLKKASELSKDSAKISGLEEQIRVCEKSLAKLASGNLKASRDPSKQDLSAPVAKTDPSATPTEESRKAHPEPKAGEVVDLQIKDLGNFNYDNDKGGNIPADVKRLNGAKIRLHGYMIPMDQAEAITQFALVPSLFACCFGQPPQVQHTIVSHCPKGKAVGYCPDELVVEGTLKVDEKKDDGFIVSIFELDISSVKPAPK